MQNLPSGKGNSVFYPDGTWAPRPHDGYVFTDHKGVQWVFDGYREDWNLSKKNMPMSGDFNTGRFYTAPEEKKVEKKCECGSEIAKVDGHSKWCPKYEA